jgi:SAM-dependent methyltransferase
MLAKQINPAALLHAVEVDPMYYSKLSEKGIIVHSLDIEKETLPFSNCSVDIIILNQVLEHIKEIFWVFHEITRVLTVGGKLILGVPNLASLHNRVLLAFGKQPTSIKSNSAHLRGFTKGDIINFVESCYNGGYKLKAFGGSNFYPFPPMLAKPLANIFPTMAWGIFFMFEKQREYKKQFIEFPILNHLETNFYLGAS